MSQGKWIAVLACAASIPAAACADPKPAAAIFECRFTEDAVAIDGRADESAWKSAQVIDHFYASPLSPSGREGDKAPAARTATRARLLWDRTYLYFFADMEDADLVADVKERDGQLWTNDSFAVYLKPTETKPGYFEFQINAAGAVLDAFIPQSPSPQPLSPKGRGAGVMGKNTYERYRKDGEFRMEVAVVRRGTLEVRSDADAGWSVEGRIPWTDFLRVGGRPNPDERWRFALGRYDYSAARKPEISTNAPLLARSDFHDTNNYATVQFTIPGSARRVPLTTSRVVGAPEPPPPYRIKKVYPNLKIAFPIAVVREPDSDRLLIVHSERSSGSTSISRLRDDPAATELELLIKLEDSAYDITFHPDFKRNGYIYVGSNGPQGAPPARRQTRVTRYTLEPPDRIPSPPAKEGKRATGLDPKSAQVIIEWWSDGHNGGAVAFGHDGMLYITTGDGTSDSDTNIVGQDMSTLLAKVLRIDVDHPDKGRMYSVPKDNPFVNHENTRPEIWAYGLRNPWRMTVDKKAGHIWVTQNGQDLWEQVYLVKKGDNYGWSVMEGSYPFYPLRKLGPTPLVKPTVEHHHSEARSLTGGIVYYGSRFPELQGAYIYGDYSTGKVWGVRHDGQRILWHKELADTRLAITGFGTDSQGELLIADHRAAPEAGFYTFEPTPAESRVSTFPRKLSESGLFRSVKGHVMEPGMIPYSVVAPLWGDHAFKERWLGLPGDERITYTNRRGWNLPEQTVIVKSFGLELEEGNPASRRWIETRFLTNQKGEWSGYSYAWNDEQTEGVLVDGKGADREFVIKTAAGERKQTWHFPSRTECMVCHSRAANWVLGLSAVQMSVRQLASFEQYGIFKFDWQSEARTALREHLKETGMTDTQIQEFLRKNATPYPYPATSPSGEKAADKKPAASPMFTRPLQTLERLVDPYDAKQDLSLRARSYLHSNCAQCHIDAGGGNSQFNVDFSKKLDDMQLIDIKPLHDNYGLPGARLVAPGSPETSVLLRRVAHRGRGQMPPLATSLVDQAAVEMLREWILSLAKGR